MAATINDEVLAELRAIEALSAELKAALVRLNNRLDAGERRQWRIRADDDDERGE